MEAKHVITIAREFGSGGRLDFSFFRQAVVDVVRFPVADKYNSHRVPLSRARFSAGFPRPGRPG